MSPRRSSAWRRRLRRSGKLQVVVGALSAVVAVAVAVGCISLIDDHTQSANDAAFASCGNTVAAQASDGRPT